MDPAIIQQMNALQVVETRTQTLKATCVYKNASNIQPQQSQCQELVQMNGRKVLGPPENWLGTPPSSSCELFIRRIPKDFDEQKLICPFLRFGRIYEFRLPMDFNQANRGYAYVKYTNEEDAACAMEVLEHYYIGIRQSLEILHSYEKCRLFVSNIPKHLSETEIETNLRQVFPTMQRIFTRGDDSGSTNITPVIDNRGHVFVHFASHALAVEAKKSTTPGLIRMWGRDLKVVWANTEREPEKNKTTKTLFVRNVDLSVNSRDIVEMLVKHVPRTSIRKISKVRTTAFVDFTTREAAETILQQIQGTLLRGHRLDIEWAKPSDQKSLHRMRNTDFDAILRLKCIANGWQIPVVIFGTYYEVDDVQYGAIMLRDDFGNTRAVYALLKPHELVDIHARLCETACALIETIGCFPDYNYLFYVQKDSAHLLGMVSSRENMMYVIAAHGVPSEFLFDYNEISDLSWAICYLSSVTDQVLIHAYQQSFCVKTACTYLHNWSVAQRCFGTIMPKYRNKPPLKYNLNDSQIVLALCYSATGTNCSFPGRRHITYPVSQFDNGYRDLPYNILKLMPIALTQSRSAATHLISYIQFGGLQYYHPAQRIMTPPIWISLWPYRVSIKQLPSNRELTRERQRSPPPAILPPN